MAILVVSLSDTCSNPWTMMIKARYTVIAVSAVRASGRPENTTGCAVFDSEMMRVDGQVQVAHFTLESVFVLLRDEGGIGIWFIVLYLDANVKFEFYNFRYDARVHG